MGIDIGTSGVRAALFDIDGIQAGFCHKEYPSICEQPGRLEIDPETVFESMVEVAGRCAENAGASKSDIRAVGFGTQMHSIMAVDKDWFPLTRVMTWADYRGSKEADFIKSNFDSNELYRRTGCRVEHPLYPISKILWLKNNSRDIYEKTQKFVSIKEFILHKLYGCDAIDITDASTTGCFNIYKRSWDEVILKEVLGISRVRLGEAVECTHVLRHMKKEFAGAMGIDPDTPAASGSGDGILANLGCGVFDDSSMSSTIGTSGALRIASGAPFLDPYQRTWCYCFTEDTWVAGGAISNAGIVLRWLRDEFRAQFEADAAALGIKSLYSLFDRYASEIRPGSDGLVFIPYILGERSPDWNVNAKGTIHGLTISHGRKHLVRAAMEGVMFRMFSVYEVISAINSNIKSIKANGGYANSEIWMQIQADIFGKDIIVAGGGEASVLGAAYTGMAAVGAVPNMKTALKGMFTGRVVKPVKENHELYMEIYRRAMEVYDMLK